MHANELVQNAREELIDAIKDRVRSIGEDVISLERLDVRQRERDMSRPFSYLRLCNVYLDEGGVLRGDLMGDPHAEPVSQFGMDIEGLNHEDLKHLLSRLNTGKYTAIEDIAETPAVKDTGARRRPDHDERGFFRRAQTFMHPLRKGA